MNEEPPPPFDILGDAPVEARIVAWVLGEASAFEAAELERLCEERPELMIFRRRMHALHGLFTEAEAAETDHSWKLPPEKRKALDEILGQEKVVLLETQKERRIRRAGFRAFFAIAACLVLAVVVLQLIHPIWITQGPLRSAEKKVDFMPPSEKSDPALALHELNKAVRDQEDKVEERRKVLATIVRTKGIIYKGQDYFYGQSGVDEDQGARSALQTHNQLEQDKMQLESQVNSLLKYDKDQLMTYASAIDVPDNTVKNLQPQYLDAERQLESARGSGLGNDHPTMKAAVEQVQATKRQMNEGVINLRATLQAQLALTNDRLKNVEVMKSDSREESIKRGLDAQDYADAKRDFETDQQLLQAMKLKQIEQTITNRISDKSIAFNNPAGAAGESTPPSDGPYKIAAAKKNSGSSQSASENQLAKQATVRLPDAKPAGLERNASLPAPDSPSEMAAMPPIAASDMSGGWGGRAELRARAVPPPVGQNAFARDSASALLKSKARSDFDASPPVLASQNFASAPTPNRQSGGIGVGMIGSISETSDITQAPTEHLDQIRKTLYTAEGNLNLGKYDDAKKAYQDALKIDRNNSTARRGLEKVEAAKSDYYRAAYDHTRAELLSQVDSTWELSVPADEKRADMKIVRELLPTENEPPELANSLVQGGNKLFDWNVFNEKTKNHVAIQPVQQQLVDLIEEIPAVENPYSTFSLNISDASFQLAKAALARGERPDPTSIKPEQFYNAVDYGDPAPASNESVAATIEQSAHPVIPGRNLVRVALRTGSVGRSAVQPLRLTLLVDQSGSMVREDRRASMEHALSQLGTLLTKNDLVTVIGFSRTPHLLADGMTGDQPLKLTELVNQAASEGGTNLEEALKLGGQLAERHQLAGAQNRIVLFTDGAANLGDANPDRLAVQVKSFRQKGLAFDIAGIGADGLNDRLLSELARNGNGRYYIVGNEKNDSFARQLAGAFRPAAENVKVQVNFNPQRVGKYKLLGFEKDRLKTEDFRNDAVDAAELAAEEAGVAIYQVEPLADGTGEIGEVSVRFRDAASKEMVERTWTIPYDAQATAFDRAAPSMQLAGLSMLAAEKLKGGPLADAIDFKQLTGSEAFVKQFYGSSPRVADMLRVIDALK